MLSLSYPQYIYLNKLQTKFRAFVGGFGSGKTFVGCLDLLNFSGKYPGYIQAYYAPTYGDIRDTFFPAVTEAAELLGFRIKINKTDKEVFIYRGRKYYGAIICRSMDNPSSIVGYKVVRSLVDEIDVLARDKANEAWNKLIARQRLKIDGVLNDVGVTTTPEGFKFVYESFKKNPTERYSMVQCSTRENEEYLPDDYIDSLLETYTEELASAYVNGQFVNLTSGTVYNKYDRVRNRSTESIQEKEPLRIGMDFNVTNMSAVIYVLRGKVWHAVSELTGIYDTPEMIKTINEKFPEHNIRVYPDASGKSRKSVNASTSDIALLEDHYLVYYNESNPFVKDRVLAANKAFESNMVVVNDDLCPEYADCLEQQAYDKNGEPDKKSGHDHLNDAGTYPIAFEMPVLKPAHNINLRFAM